MQSTLKLVDTSVGKKAIIGATGALLFGFVVVHCLGNALILFALIDPAMGQSALNEYGEMLHAIPELLWGARIVLLGSVVTHIALTVQLASQNAGARSSRYKKPVEGTDQGILQRYARQTMIWSGPILALYIVFHLAHLTVGVNLPIAGYEYEHLHPYENMIGSFRAPWVSAIYIAASLFLGLHIYHGGQAVLSSLGLRHPNWDGRTRPGAMAIAVVVTLVNVSIAILASTGLLG